MFCIIFLKLLSNYPCFFADYNSQHSMAYRRPPSDVESMVSLRVDNLPYRAVPEVEINSACVISENRRFCCIIVFIFQDLKPLFEKYGDVGDIYLPTERGTGRSRGFAFVRYYDRRDAEVF